MQIGGLLNTGAEGVLESSLRFAAQRQRLIAHNIANISTPQFQTKDVSPREFQAALQKAVDHQNQTGQFQFPSTRAIQAGPDGSLTLNPKASGDSILFHDQNNRDVESLMKDLAENATAYRVSAELLRGQMDIVRSAISGRV